MGQSHDSAGRCLDQRNDMHSQWTGGCIISLEPRLTASIAGLLMPTPPSINARPDSSVAAQKYLRETVHEGVRLTITVSHVGVAAAEQQQQQQQQATGGTS